MGGGRPGGGAWTGGCGEVAPPSGDWGRGPSHCVFFFLYFFFFLAVARWGGGALTGRSHELGRLAVAPSRFSDCSQRRTWAQTPRATGPGGDSRSRGTGGHGVRADCPIGRSMVWASMRGMGAIGPRHPILGLGRRDCMPRRRCVGGQWAGGRGQCW